MFRAIMQCMHTHRNAREIRKEKERVLCRQISQSPTHPKPTASESARKTRREIIFVASKENKSAPMDA